MELKCQYCGLNVDLPFRCPFCGGYYCADHRLPEFHACREIKRSAFVSEERPLRELGKEIEELLYGGEHSKTFLPLRRISSLREIAHLSLGTLIVALVGVSLVSGNPHFLSWQLALFSAAILTLTFIPHELAHKFTAKYYGLWAEFRLSFVGVVITLISILLPIKIVSPGTVVISGEATRRTVGKISLSGPFVNMVLSLAFLVLSNLFNAEIVGVLLAQGSFINAFVALFNLIPFSIFDGAKVMWWNKYFWAMAFLSSLILVAISLTI